MREILFRGRCSGGPWLYGSLLVYKDGYCEICVPDGEDALEKFRVDPETVGQFTGLTDKNGKKIFEGDILKSATVFVVDFFEGGFVLRFGEGGMEYFHEHYLDEMEVIGNIHDNPELLGGADNG